MKYLITLLLIIFSTTFLFCQETHVVTKIISGTSLQIDNKRKIRLIGVKTPDRGNSKSARFFRSKIKKFLKENVLGREVFLLTDDSVKKRSYFYVIIDDGTNLNRKLISKGYAITNTNYHFSYKREFLEIQSIANNYEIGLWDGEKHSLSEVFDADEINQKKENNTSMNKVYSKGNSSEPVSERKTLSSNNTNTPTESKIYTRSYTPTSTAGKIWVNSYTRKDGTPVSGYWRKR